MTETEVWEWMMEGNYPPGYPDMDQLDLVPLERRAIATLSADVPYTEEVKRKVITPAMRRKGKTTREIVETLRKGTKVKIVMASRMGVVGITPDLDATRGYCVRIPCIETDYVGYPIEPTGLLTNIEPIEDNRPEAAPAHAAIAAEKAKPSER